MNTIDTILKAIEENGEDTNCLWIEDLLKKLKNKVIVYMVEHNACCENKNFPETLSQDQMIKLNSKIATLYLVDKSKLDKMTGDDWDDAPSCCNSGSPYDEEKLGIEKIQVVLGKGLEL